MSEFHSERICSEQQQEAFRGGGGEIRNKTWRSGGGGGGRTGSVLPRSRSNWHQNRPGSGVLDVVHAEIHHAEHRSTTILNNYGKKRR